MISHPRRPARLLAVTVALVAGLVASLVGAPAQASVAYTPPVVSSPDTSTNGHVKGTVLTEAPYVRIDLLDASTSAVLATTTVAAAAPAPYDFETMTSWTIAVRATACASAVDCTGPSSTTGPVPATSVTARVTWPGESYAVGTARNDYTVLVQDVGAGGFLRARWNGHTMPVASTGDTDVMPILGDDGVGLLTIERCSTTRPDAACAPTGSTPVRVWRHFHPVAKGGGTFSADATTAPDGVGRYALGVTGATVTFDYTLRPVGGPDPVRSGSVISTRDSSGVDTVPVDLTGLPDDSYLLEGTFTFDVAPYGTISGTPEGPQVVLTLDTRAPDVRDIAFDRSTVYPLLDGYQDTVSFHVTGDGQDTSLAQATYDVLDSAGHVVWSLSTTPPPGLTGDGGTWVPDAAPAGTYVVRATVRDLAGNTSVLTSAPVTLSWARLVHRQLGRVITAKASLVGRSVGRCSTLRRPSLHGWKGSLGLYSATRCRTRGAPGTVRTIHHLRVPAGIHDGTVSLWLFGAAAHGRPRSTVSIGWRAKDGTWLPSRRLRGYPGSHGKVTASIADLAAGGYLTWATTVTRRSRYDVGGFDVGFEYTVLR